MLQLRISLISGMSPTHNSEIPPADRSERNLTVSRIFSVRKWRRPAVISAFDFFMSLFYTKIDWFS